MRQELWNLVEQELRQRLEEGMYFQEEDAVQRDTDTVTLVDEEEGRGLRASRDRLRWGKDVMGVTPRGSGRRQWEEAGPAGPAEEVMRQERTFF